MTERDNGYFRKNDILKELEIGALSSDGSGIAKIDGYPVFIKDTLPGDVVSIKIIKVKKDLAFGKLISVEKNSPDRVLPKCDKARPCGGCTLQEFAYEKQLAYKDDKVYNCLLRIGGIPAKILDTAREEPVGMENPWRYRNKAQYPIGTDRNGRIVSGFFAGRTHSIIEAKECWLNPSEFSSILRTFLGFCEENRLKPYDEKSGNGNIRHLVIRKAFGTGEIMAMPVIKSLKHFGKDLKEALREALVGIPGLTTIVLNENPEKTNVILGRKTEIIYGPGFIMDQMNGLKFKISPHSFYQINSLQAERVYKKAIEYAKLTGNEKVYDLCCGTGTISLFVAKALEASGAWVSGIDIVPEAIDDAKYNARINNISNVDFIAAAVEELLPKIRDISADAVILDPPRAGMERPALDAIVKASPSRIVYISCDPATLARDIKVFLASGYHLSRFVTIDQFCQTSHVETVALLINQNEKAKHHVRVGIDAEEYYSKRNK
ncbi:MAG: 23S rRNA (uracil(1939)-C(5))-methyltransferase RlmD [Lachnospiraceae bacterium]|nr:23S rRNA (uracil(1939)-C(5))-methyltransferase RlmD [Lachnospiraceae bacterium]